MRLPRTLTALLLFAPLAGCLSLGDEAPTVIYAPQPAVAADAGWPKVEWSLLVATPQASEMLDSARIAVRPEAGLLQVYKGAAWSDPLPQLLQTAVLRGFEDSGRILSVGRTGSGQPGERNLLLDIRRWESVYSEPKSVPQVVIEVQATLLAQPGGRVVAARTFRQAVPAADEKMPAVMAAFEIATGQLVTELVGWTLREGQPAAK